MLKFRKLELNYITNLENKPKVYMLHLNIKWDSSKKKDKIILTKI